MFNSLFEALSRRGASNQQPEDLAKRRRHSRRSVDKCVAVVNGKTYPALDWSLGGVQITGDDRVFAMNDECEVLLKFKLSNELLEVPHKAKVVRKGHDRIAFQFAPLSTHIRKSFQHVVDDYVATRFADSQMA